MPQKQKEIYLFSPENGIKFFFPLNDPIRILKQNLFRFHALTRQKNFIRFFLNYVKY
jgi:hypothetical protein